jgi:hypothetical protein
VATAKWSAYSGIATALSSALNSLASAAVAVSAAIANGTNLNFYMDVELTLGTINLSSATNPAVYLWVLSEVDGSNYEYGSAGSIVPARAPDAIIALPAASLTGPQYFDGRVILIPPGNFMIALQNNTGVAFASSGNSLQYNTYTETVA